MQYRFLKNQNENSLLKMLLEWAILSFEVEKASSSQTKSFILYKVNEQIHQRHVVRKFSLFNLLAALETTL